MEVKYNCLWNIIVCYGRVKQQKSKAVTFFFGGGLVAPDNGLEFSGEKSSREAGSSEGPGEEEGKILAHREHLDMTLEKKGFKLIETQTENIRLRLLQVSN